MIFKLTHVLKSSFQAHLEFPIDISTFFENVLNSIFFVEEDIFIFTIFFHWS